MFELTCNDFEFFVANNFATIAWRTEVMVHRTWCRTRRILDVPLVRVSARLAFTLPLGCRHNGPFALRYKAHSSKVPQLRLSGGLNLVTSGRTRYNVSSYTRRRPHQTGCFAASASCAIFTIISHRTVNTGVGDSGLVRGTFHQHQVPQ